MRKTKKFKTKSILFKTLILLSLSLFAFTCYKTNPEAFAINYHQLPPASQTKKTAKPSERKEKSILDTTNSAPKNSLSHTPEHKKQ